MTAPFRPVSTGQGFPEGCRVEGGFCDQCGAGRDLVRSQTRLSSGYCVWRRVCAECLAGFVAGLPAVPGASIWVENTDGALVEVRAEPAGD